MILFAWSNLRKYGRKELKSNHLVNERTFLARIRTSKGIQNDFDKVIDADERTIGKMNALLVNKQAERVVYFGVEANASLI